MNAYRTLRRKTARSRRLKRAMDLASIATPDTLYHSGCGVEREKRLSENAVRTWVSANSLRATLKPLDARERLIMELVG